MTAPVPTSATTVKAKSRGRLCGVGMVFLIVAFSLLLAAWNTGTNLLYIVLGGVVSFMLLSTVLSRWTLRGLVLTRETPYAVDRGQPFPVHVRVENNKRFFPSISVRVESTSREEKDRSIRARGYVLKIPAKRAAILDLQDVYPRRGVHKLPPLRLVTSFPFGIAERSRVFSDNLEIIVYPRVQTVRMSPLDHMQGGSQIPRTVAGDGDEFFCLREYVAGDDLRNIVWRISARLGKWMVREMSVQHSRFIVIIFDACRTDGVEDFDEQFEDAVDLAASVAVSMLRRRYSVSIHTQGHHLEFGEGAAHEHQVLELLARVEPVESETRAQFEAEISKYNTQPVSVMQVTPDPRRWGEPGRSGGRTLDPRELIHG